VFSKKRRVRGWSAPDSRHFYLPNSADRVFGRDNKQKQADDDEEAMDFIKGVSPIAWQHVNLFGKFEFNQAASELDIDALTARYNDPVCRSKALKEEKEDHL
jgi:hypothetical protein